MRRQTAGFTGIEILIVLVIGGILMGMALPAFGRAISRRGALNARDALVVMGARARSTAIERGATVKLGVDVAAGRTWIVEGMDTLDVLDYSGEFDAKLRAIRNGAMLEICFTPRGVGGACNATTALPDTVIFTRGPHSARAAIRVLGQVSRL